MNKTKTKTKKPVVVVKPKPKTKPKGHTVFAVMLPDESAVEVSVESFVTPYERAHKLAEALFAAVCALPVNDREWNHDEALRDRVEQAAHRMIRRTEALLGLALVRAREDGGPSTDGF